MRRAQLAAFEVWWERRWSLARRAGPVVAEMSEDDWERLFRQWRWDVEQGRAE